MECSICGKDFQSLSEVEIEGSIVEVCDLCSHFGKRVQKVRQTSYSPIKKEIRIKSLAEEEFELAPNYGRIIKEARERKGISRKYLAEILNEKESIFKRIEDEVLEPSKELIKKIEKLLDVKITGEYKEEKWGKKPIRSRITIGDVAEVK